MNTVLLVGRFTRDPILKETQSNTSIAYLTLAVDRDFKSMNDQSADFIDCIAFNRKAEIIKEYCQKGSLVAITAHIQSNTYETKDQSKVYSKEVVIDKIKFLESKAKQENRNQNSDFVEIFDDDIQF